MKAELKTSSVNQITKDTVIYSKEDEVNSISLIVKGRVSIKTAGTKATVSSGAFLGIHDLFSTTYQADYTAETNCVIYCFPATGNIRDLLSIMQTNMDYGSLMVTSASKYIRDLSQIAEQLHSLAEELPDFLQKYYQYYTNIGRTQGASFNKISAIENISPIDDNQKIELAIEPITYYSACCGIKPDIQKAYYGSNTTICIYHIRDQISLIHQLYNYCEAYTSYIVSLFAGLITDSRSIYANMAKLTLELSRMGVSTKETLSYMDELIDKINSVDSLLCEKTGTELAIDREAMENAYFSALNADSSKPADSDASGEINAPDRSALGNSLEQILEYSECDEETQEAFKNAIQKFIDLEDKLSSDDDARRLRKEIIKPFYGIYQKVFLKDYNSSEKTPLVIDLFLKYAYVSEHLLSDDIIDDLLSLDGSTLNNSPCMVYNMKEWLTAVYKGEKEPSKNEFDLDYTEYLRDQRKTASITAEEEKRLALDQDKKLEYEIQNMFRYTHRILSGQISTFVPVLYTDICVGSLSNAFLAKDKVNAAVRRLMSIDFSVFHREILYSNPEIGIQKEYIMQKVCPDIILIPAFGNKGQMWQELSGKRRNSQGRFLFPIFLEGNMLDQVITRCCGQFRWELCRTMQGAAWNNVQVKSLTSEYSDFIQFYRKNHDLSEEKKAKLKLQIQKCRNSTREVFTLDYETWIKNESHSAVTLTKPVREIMATYCPFTKEIRESQAAQPIFADAFARFKRERGKKNREMDLRFRVLEKDGIEIPQELIETKEYYNM